MSSPAAIRRYERNLHGSHRHSQFDLSSMRSVLPERVRKTPANDVPCIRPRLSPCSTTLDRRICGHWARNLRGETPCACSARVLPRCILFFLVFCHALPRVLVDSASCGFHYVRTARRSFFLMDMSYVYTYSTSLSCASSSNSTNSTGLLTFLRPLGYVLAYLDDLQHQRSLEAPPNSLDLCPAD
jgi:hypothetical protein